MPCTIPEPSLAELLDDPILHLLCLRDGVSSDSLRELIETMRARLNGSAAPTT